MTGQPTVKDLLVLVADGQMEFTVRGLLTRWQSLEFREVSADIYVHPAKAPGCLLRAHDFVRAFQRQYGYALVMFDREGCGNSQETREALEAEVEARLAAAGWKDRSAAIVLDPELEVWVWSDSPEVDAALGWSGRTPSLTQWLRSEGFLRQGEAKPRDAKRAVDEAMRVAGKRRSSAIYRRLAERVSLHRCADPAFRKLKAVLQSWFPQAP
ncbi:MAG: hypothetical protein NUV77_15670 [Thermoguttaceae bacterium]|jgi:hypothetical protein|nr:hypothetical protein [Thermoguttaceae bacterium]